MKKSYALFAALLFSLISFSQNLIISEFRVRGPNGHNDEFIEIYNNSDVPHTVAASSGTGYGVVASDGITRASIPNGTVIPARGHWLAVNSIGYSLSSYPAGNGTTATGDATYTTDIPNNVGIALFNNNVAANYTMANRLDAAGSTTEMNVLYKEGAGYPSIVAFSMDYCFHRKQINGRPQDTDNNGVDFKFEDTNGISAGAGQSLGAPGPENSSSPVVGSGGIVVTYLDQAQPSNVAPNFVREFISDQPNNSTLGTIDLRFKVTNNTSVNVTRLRLRITDITTFPAPSAISDLRARTSSDIVVPTSMGNVTVKGTMLEQPPGQPNGGGFNSSMSVNSVTLATPINPGATQYIRVLIGVQQAGDMRAKFLLETLPEGGGGFGGSGVGSSFPFGYSGTDVSAFFNADLPCAGITVTNPATATGTLGVAFSQSFTSNSGSGTVNYTTISALPSGVALAPDGTLSGTPEQTGSFPITVNATDANGCTGTSSTYNLVIGCPSVSVNVVSNQNVCAGTLTAPVNFSGSPASDVTYTWANNMPSFGLAANGTGNIPAFTAMNASSSPVTAIITVTPTYTFGSGSCPGSPITFTITVTNSLPPVINTQPQDAAACVGSNVTFKVEATNALSYQWQLSTGNGYNNIAGATAATLSIPNVTAAMNNYKYRVVIQGLCSSVISSAANLAANALPVVNLTASPYTALHPGLLTTIYATYDHTPGNFTWYRDNALLRTTTSSLLSNLDVDSLGTYKVMYTDNNGCSVTSNNVTLVADPNFQFYVYPTPNNGQFTVRFYSQVPGVKRVLRIMDSKGAMVFRQEFTMNSPFQQMAVNLTRNSAGIYYVELHDGKGKVIARGSTMVKK